MKREFSPALLAYLPVGFNIESLAVGPAEQEESPELRWLFPVMTVIEQLTKQLYKLVNVLKVQDIETPCVERELMLKVNATSSSRSEIVELAQIFRARVVDVAEDALTLEVVIRAKWSPLCRCCEFGREVARTGSRPQPGGVNTELLKSLEAKVC